MAARFMLVKYYNLLQIYIYIITIVTGAYKPTYNYSYWWYLPYNNTDSNYSYPLPCYI